MTEPSEQQWNLKRDVQEIKSTVENIYEVMHGPADSSEATGLIHKVEKNSTFRRIATAWLWLLTTGVTLGIVKVLLTEITGG